MPIIIEIYKASIMIEIQAFSYAENLLEHYYYFQ